MRVVIGLGAIAITTLLSACSSVPRPLNPVRSICTDSCMKVDDRDRAQCLAKCD